MAFTTIKEAQRRPSTNHRLWIGRTSQAIYMRTPLGAHVQLTRSNHDQDDNNIGRVFSSLDASYLEPYYGKLTLVQS